MTNDNWHAKAACRKPWVLREWFFPKDTDETLADGRTKQVYGDDGLRARLICAACPVFANCWVENRDSDTGIFAGTDEHERARMHARARGRNARAKGSSKGTNWQDVPVPDFRPVHVATPSVPLQIALYAFKHGESVREAMATGKVGELDLRRAIDESRRAA